MLNKDENSILYSINDTADLRKLDPKQLPFLCNEIRQFIINHLSDNPGHFASNLGTVELTVALHYIFNTPQDRIVWDVGHQAYTHKILTGRRDVFHTNRMHNGISGFPNPKESEFDTFTAGHASNSISAALGMSVANSLKEVKDSHVIAVIGDASISGGLAFEGLNNASSSKNNMLIILNDNNMAIDHNVGALNEYFVNLTTSKRYNRLRYNVYKTFKKANLISDDLKSAIMRFNNSLKSLITRHQNIFEGLNIRYFGPVDGHDTESLIRTLAQIKDMDGPKILHVCTRKGKGYAPAEDETTIWHAPGKFNAETGERIIANTENVPPLFQDVFGDTLVELAEANDKIVGITPAMPSGSSMIKMFKRFPKRSFDVGIAEEHAVTFSGGLAYEGIIPFCNIYSTFMQRAYDQVIHDVAIQNLPVIFCLDRAGLVGEDGPTHHGVFDLSYFRAIPNMTVSAPINEIWLRNLMFTAQKNLSGPFMIRYPRGRGVITDWKKPFETVEVGKGYCLKEGTDVAILSIGTVGNSAIEAVKKLEGEDVSVAIYDMVFVKPLDTELLHEVFKKFSRVITIEDGCLSGGFGSAVLEFMSDNGYCSKVKRLGIPDRFIEHGPVKLQHEICGFGVDQIKSTILELAKA